MVNSIHSPKVYHFLSVLISSAVLCHVDCYISYSSNCDFSTIQLNIRSYRGSSFVEVKKHILSIKRFLQSLKSTPFFYPLWFLTPSSWFKCSVEISSGREYWNHFRRAHPDKDYPVQKNHVCDICGKCFQVICFFLLLVPSCSRTV